ncbi:MAG TPA: DNA primase [Hyphomicrobiaceae bacterium]|nr:DNA primase [Hyphomicrobiaceae bacterium]
MRYPPSILDEIRARLPVSQVVARKVALKKAGREFKGLSPFKTERTPSFFVNDQKGFYHCFASGEHGDIFSFVMKTEGLSFMEAIERLAGEAGVPLPKPAERDQRREDERTRLYSLLEASAKFFEERLSGLDGAEARRYIEKRGLARHTLAEFRIGFAPPGRSVLKAHLAKAGYAVEEMIQSGMLIGGEDIAEPYDRFRNRVMIPIADAKGRIIAFGGRALDPAAPAKYLNSPETPLFHKGSVLFNAHRARTAAFEKSRIIAVEGYLDVIAFHEAGIKECVAPLGTALTEEQVGLLWRLSPEPILCFDGDSAGRKAAWRAIDVALPHLKPGASLRFAFLPDGLDPDDLVRQSGADAARAILETTRPLADVLWEREWSSGDWSTPERRAGLERQLAGHLARIADGAVRGHYDADMRGRLAKAWGQGRTYPARPGQLSHRATGSTSGFRPKFGQGRPGGQGFPNQPPPGASSSLRNSRLVQGGLQAPPYREALLLRTLINHPWLLDEDAERIAELPMTSAVTERLRDALLSIHAANNPLDRTTLASQLTALGLGKVLDLVERSITHRSDKFSEPDADRAAVEAGWHHATAIHDRQVGLRRALAAAEQAWLTDASAEALDRITALQQQLALTERSEDAGSEGTLGARRDGAMA